MIMAGITTTGNSRIDGATAEIAGHLRDADPGKRDQVYYDEAMRLRDAILMGASELAVSELAKLGTHDAAPWAGTISGNTAQCWHCGWAIERPSPAGRWSHRSAA
jgi:hypothetical protein